MTLEITLAPEEEAKLRDKAAAEHIDVLTFAREAVLYRINRPTFTELLAPIDAAVKRSGMTEEEIEENIEQGRNEVWQRRQAEKNRGQ
jgi:hypothetical protein